MLLVCFSTTGMPLNMFGLGIGTTFDLLNFCLILITYIYLLVGYNFSCLIGGGCGVGLGLGWGFGNAYGCQYRSSRVQFQGIEFQKKAEGDDAPKVVSPEIAEKSRPYG